MNKTISITEKLKIKDTYYWIMLCYSFIAAFIYVIVIYLTDNAYVGFFLAGLGFTIFVWIVNYFFKLEVVRKLNKEVNKL